MADTSRCQIARPQAGWFGAQGHTTTYHDWTDHTGLCRFCGMTRLQTRLAPGPQRDRWERVLAEMARIGEDPRADRYSPAASAYIQWREEAGTL